MTGRVEGPAPAAELPSQRLARGSNGPVGWWWVGVNALVFGLLGWLYLFLSHPHEDAYILFRYVENLLAGHGFSYSTPYAPAEGATDFLWLLALTAVTGLGLPVALAALVLNTAGAGLWTYSLLGVWRRCLGVPTSSPWTVASVLVLPLTLPALSAYGGFSTMLYVGLTAWALFLTLTLRGRRLAWIPWVGLALGLFRPDGVILGVGFTVVALVRAVRQRAVGPFLASAAAAAVAGLGYFAWRAWYFGHLLPLPLYVKQHYDPALTVSRGGHLLGTHLPFLPGLWPTVVFVGRFVSPLLLSLGVLLAWDKTWSRRRRLLIAALPVVAHGVVLAFAHLSQNFHSRFHGPEFAVLFLVWAGLSLEAARRLSPRRRLPRLALRGAHVAILLYCVALTVPRLEAMWLQWDYIDVFPVRLAEMTTGEDDAVITEAGRMAYWTSMELTDLVGLNTPATALRPLSREEVGAEDPEMVFFHPTWMADPRPVGFFLGPVRGLSPAQLRAVMVPVFGGRSMSEVTEYSDRYFPARVAAMSAADYLLAHADRYRIYAVAYRTDMHVYGFRRDAFDQEAIEAALVETSRPENHRSYLDLVGLAPGG